MNLLTSKIKLNWKAGLTVSLVSIPLSVSLAIAAGSTPVAGIITAIWAGFFAALLGGSDFNIVGPTGALSGVLAMYAFLHGPESLAMLAIASGVVILIAWLLKLERYLIFIPANTIHGFTLGVAFIIGMNQLNFALGLSKLPGHEKFIDNVIESFRHISQASPTAFIVFLLFFIGIFITEKYRSKISLLSHIPATPLFAVLGILLGYLSTNKIIPFTVSTLASKYPNLTPKLFAIPHFNVAFDNSFVVACITVSLIAIIETMLSARIADSMTKTKHNKRKEMLGLGIANIASGIAGGIPATAALARTSLNVKSGATHKTSGLINAVSVAVISLFLLPYFTYIPLPVIAAILVTVAVRMIGHEHFVRMYQIDKKSFFMSLLVAFVTIYVDPIIGILIGASISLFLFLENLSHGQFDLIINDVNKKIVGHVSGKRIDSINKKSHTIVYSIRGHFTYLDSQSHVSRFDTDHQYTNVILRLRELYFIDMDGVDAFEEIVEMLERRKINVYVTGANELVMHMLLKSKHFVKLQNEDKVFMHTSDALARLGIKLGSEHRY